MLGENLYNNEPIYLFTGMNFLSIYPYITACIILFIDLIITIIISIINIYPYIRDLIFEFECLNGRELVGGRCRP